MSIGFSNNAIIFTLKGRLTDGKGKTIECKNAIFIMTSNLGNEEIAEHAMQLRAEAEKLLNRRLVNTANEDQEPEHIEISRNFKDQVVCKIYKRYFEACRNCVIIKSSYRYVQY